MVRVFSYTLEARNFFARGASATLSPPVFTRTAGSWLTTMLATRAPSVGPSWRRLGERTCHSDMHGDASAIACADWCKQEKAHNHW